MHREREAEHGRRTHLRRRPAGHARARRTPAAQERKPVKRVGSQLLNHRDPGRIQLTRRCLAAPAGHHVRLLHKRHAHALRPRRLGRRHQVACRHSTARAVPQHERGQRPVGRLHMHARWSVRCVELHDPGEPSVLSAAHV